MVAMSEEEGWAECTSQFAKEFVETKRRIANVAILLHDAKCPHCRKALPELDRVAETFRSEEATCMLSGFDSAVAAPKLPATRSGCRLFGTTDKSSAFRFHAFDGNGSGGPGTCGLHSQQEQRPERIRFERLPRFSLLETKRSVGRIGGSSRCRRLRILFDLSLRRLMNKWRPSYDLTKPGTSKMIFTVDLCKNVGSLSQIF